MKKIILVSLMSLSINCYAFFDFNNYQSPYADNDWPVWTPMYWMEEIFDNDRFGNSTRNMYPYPYGNQPFNIQASHFDMSQMPTPNEAYLFENKLLESPVYHTPAAQFFANPESVETSKIKTQNPYLTNHQPNPYRAAYPGNF